MTKWQDINDIMKTRSPELLLSALWDDPSTVRLIRKRLDAVSIEGIKHYHGHFVGDTYV